MLHLVQGGARSAAGGPSAGLLTEPIRGLADHAALLLATPGLLAAPRGDGHGVLIFPGLLAGDSSTVPLWGFLRWLGYDGFGVDLARFWLIADRSARPAVRQVPFRPSLPLRPLYPRPAQDPR